MNKAEEVTNGIMDLGIEVVKLREENKSLKRENKFLKSLITNERSEKWKHILKRVSTVMQLDL